MVLVLSIHSTVWAQDPRTEFFLLVCLVCRSLNPENGLTVNVWVDGLLARLLDERQSAGEQHDYRITYKTSAIRGRLARGKMQIYEILPSLCQHRKLQ